MKKILLVILHLKVGFMLLTAQQLPVFSQVHHNPYLINPARAGNNPNTLLNLHHRHHMLGFASSPYTSIISFETRLTEYTGLGLIISNDVENIIENTRIAGAYSHNFEFLSGHRIGLGLSAGIIQNRLRHERIKAQHPGESSMLTYMERGTAVDADFGINYSFGELQVDFSATNLIARSIMFQNQSDEQQLHFRLIRHFHAMAQYRFVFNHIPLSIKPVTLIRNVQGMPIQYEILAITEWLQNYRIVLGYRHGYGLVSGFGLYIHENISLNYTHDFTLGNQTHLTQGAGEISLRFIIGQQRDMAGRPLTRRDFRDLDREKRHQHQEIDRLQQEKEKLEKHVERSEEIILDQKMEIEELKRIQERDRAELEKARNMYEYTHNESKNNLEELEDGGFYYIVLAAYLNFSDAKFFQRILEREINLQTTVFAREDGKYYFVYSRAVKSWKDVSDEFSRLKKLDVQNYIDGNIWIYRSRGE